METTVLAIIEQKSRRMDAYIPHDVAQFIAENAQGNVREVEGSQQDHWICQAPTRSNHLKSCEKELQHIFQEKTVNLSLQKTSSVVLVAPII